MMILGSGSATKFTGILEFKLSDISARPTDCFYFADYHGNSQASASLTQYKHFCTTDFDANTPTKYLGVCQVSC